MNDKDTSILFDAIKHARKVLEKANKTISLFDDNIRYRSYKKEYGYYPLYNKPSLLFSITPEVSNEDDIVKIKLSCANKKINATMYIELHNYSDIYSKTIEFNDTKEKLIIYYQHVAYMPHQNFFKVCTDSYNVTFPYLEAEYGSIEIDNECFNFTTLNGVTIIYNNGKIISKRLGPDY